MTADAKSRAHPSGALRLTQADLEPPTHTRGLYCVVERGSAPSDALDQMFTADLRDGCECPRTIFSAGDWVITLAAHGLPGYPASMATAQREGDAVTVAFFGELNGGTPGGRQRSGAETLLDGYLQHREAAAASVDGVFQFAIIEPAQRRVVLGTDSWALRPLFYTSRPGFFAAAPSARALLGVCEPDLDRDALDLFLVFNFVPGERTLFEAIEEVPCASTLTWEEGQTSLRRYWAPPFPSSYRNRPEKVELGELVGLLTTVVHENVTRGGQATVPISGGFDSRVILAFVPGEVPLFTYGRPGAEDMAVAEQIAALLGYPWHTLNFGDGYLEAWMPELVRSTSGLHPAVNAHGLALRSVCRFGSVALLGNGAHSLFAFPYTSPRETTSREEITELLLSQGTAMGVRWDMLPRLLDPPRVRRVRELARAIIAARVAEAGSDRALDILTYFHLMERQRRFLDVGIQTQSSHIQFREPLFERSVAEFGLGLPPRMRYVTTWMLRRALQQRNPQLGRILRQGQRVSAVPTLRQRVRLRLRSELRARSQRARRALARWIPSSSGYDYGGFADYNYELRHGSRGIVERTLRGATHIESWLDRHGIDTFVDLHMAGRENHSAALGILLTLELAARQFLGSRGQPSST